MVGLLGSLYFDFWWFFSPIKLLISRKWNFFAIVSCIQSKMVKKKKKSDWSAICEWR